MKINETYTIVLVSSDDEYFYVDITGVGTVAIKTTAEGVVVDVFPLYIADEPLGSTWVHMSDFMEYQGESK
jgi:hypothetical protein